MAKPEGSKGADARQDDPRPDERPDKTGVVSQDVDTPYNAGHTVGMGFPDEEQGILDNVQEQERKKDPKPSTWHGDPLGRPDFEKKP